MDHSFIIVSLIVVGLVAIPYYLFISAGTSETKKIALKIKKVVLENNLQISQDERWNHKYIGIDTQQKVLVFLKAATAENAVSQDTVQILNLAHVKNCLVIEHRKGNKANAVLERLDLQIHLINGTSQLLNFYNLDDNDAEDYEVQRAEKWKTIITTQLRAGASVKRAA
ncbi:hypothetical protein AAU57_00725 [Nonlabens sp. YIK11]|uniref:hypothetical protein n=1 Tax=Nonlabens sp. YIK11 TaxID=1453349 RepID=UPI0006DBFA0F|nr:hypothetical protein [Nonlabens sp. YIK11]KQC32007.1 hypothetical protein AAU57_00725 [Nonlabens sp. YIK11]